MLDGRESSEFGLEVGLFLDRLIWSSRSLQRRDPLDHRQASFQLLHCQLLVVGSWMDVLLNHPNGIVAMDCRQRRKIYASLSHSLCECVSEVAQDEKKRDPSLSLCARGVMSVVQFSYASTAVPVSWEDPDGLALASRSQDTFAFCGRVKSSASGAGLLPAYVNLPSLNQYLPFGAEDSPRPHPPGFG